MSITHEEASFILSLSMDKMYRFMRRYGHHYPVLYVLNRGEPLDLSGISNDSVLSIDKEEKEPDDKTEHIYRTLVGFKMQDDSDERNVQVVADEVARTNNPDAIGLIMPCMYAEYMDKDAVVPETLNDEPDACTVLHMCYWLRGESKAMITQSPFQTDGRRAGKEDLEWASEDENAVNYGLVAMSYPWTAETEALTPKIANPWRKQ
jgi:hypothetical protein